MVRTPSQSEFNGLFRTFFIRVIFLDIRRLGYFFSFHSRIRMDRNLLIFRFDFGVQLGKKLTLKEGHEVLDDSLTSSGGGEGVRCRDPGRGRIRLLK
jgi:hypothetical protein